jgi:3-oxoacyl-[acyl-carrier protein] reductase
MTQEITLITGTSKGIGKFLAEYYLQKGHFVYGCSRGISTIQNPNYFHFSINITDEAAVKEIFKTIKQKSLKLDNLINNAGIASMNHSLLTPMSTVENVFKTNVFGSFLFSREAVKLMQINKYGRIVNFTTVAVPLRLEGEAIYAASKSAVETLTKVLAKEFASYNVTINAIGPTPIQTDLIKSVPEDKIKKLIESQSIKRLGNFDDVQNVIDFYLNKNSNFITGQIIYLGGL